MAPTSSRVLLPRNDPSLAELFSHFPAKVWLLLKSLIFGVALLAALSGVIFGIYCFVMLMISYGPGVIEWLRGAKWREVGQEWRDNLGRLRKIERVDRIWTWLERRRGKNEIDDVDDEAELERLDSGEGEGSVGGETLFEGEEDENGKSTPGIDG